MKRFATKTFVMTAVLAACAAGASAQSMKAEIPFTFRAGGAVLAAGTYRIDVGNTVVRVSNSDTRKSIAVMPRYRRDVEKSAVAGGSAKLWFSCAGSSCVLTSLWNGADASALVVGSPASAGKEMAEMRVVNLTVVKTE
jgi:hypothetical protein